MQVAHLSELRLRDLDEPADLYWKDGKFHIPLGIDACFPSHSTPEGLYAG